MIIDTLVIGSGPAGYTAALYSLRAGTSTALLTGNMIGGLLTTTSIVENYPGFIDGIDGNLLMQNMESQCEKFGLIKVYDTVISVDYDTYPYKVKLESEDIIEAKTIIIAAGASHKKLGIETEETYANRGVSYCATCDGFFFAGKDVVVIGGGDSACEEATHLSHMCNSVTMLVRGDKMRASQVMIERVSSNDKIKILYNQEVKEFYGDDKGLKGIITKDNTNIEVSGVFIAIGHIPNSKPFYGTGSITIETDTNGYICTTDTKTCVDGVYAAGDIQDSKYRQAITSAASGCIASINSKEFLTKNNK